MTDKTTEPRERKRDVAARWLQQGLTEGEKRLKAAAGLGSSPNVVPVATPVVDAHPRPVFVGWHPVGGFAGKWFAEQTGLGKLITEKTNSYPDPTQHWGVLVGDYVHQLWMDENFDVIYTNACVDPDEWQLFPVGDTRFNDDAIRRTGEAIIAQVRKKQAAYNLITNNCQTYALRLLDAISQGASHFPTTLSVYQTLLGPGKVVDLFKPVEEGGNTVTGDSVSNATALMQQHTNQVDTHGPAYDPVNPPRGDAGPQGQQGVGVSNGQAGREVASEQEAEAEGGNDKGEKKKKKGMFARMFRKNK
ncbi:hypothetical protein CspeluHIS016_0101540 [Cutaneotrichosporon spelunceum]|uniref:DUF862-domain-containing protein n=1 Tax=Cutaneotrichosporon spelunceum TaxID=1672016 RepID=A0AAD3TML2_9TREE|nr:hypothetical protein CspeluHIS016_0101540 [Cutaneotrichosporon spelunceum]